MKLYKTTLEILIELPENQHPCDAVSMLMSEENPSWLKDWQYVKDHVGSCVEPEEVTRKEAIKQFGDHSFKKAHKA